MWVVINGRREVGCAYALCNAVVDQPDYLAASQPVKLFFTLFGDTFGDLAFPAEHLDHADNTQSLSNDLNPRIRFHHQVLKNSVHPPCKETWDW